MDYLIGNDWSLWVIGFVVLIVIADDIWYRWEKRKLPRANRHHVQKMEPPEFIDEDELYVISNDTDEVVFTGSPAAVYDWLQIYMGATSFDIHNRGTVKTVTDEYFKTKYVE